MSGRTTRAARGPVTRALRLAIFLLASLGVVASMPAAAADAPRLIIDHAFAVASGDARFPTSELASEVQLPDDWSRTRPGYGGGVWFAAAFLRLNIAVAHGRGAATRVHVGGNVTF